MVQMIPVMLLFGPVAVLVVGFVIIQIIKALKSGDASMSKKQQDEEARMIQELYHGMKKMNERVDALETILLDRYRKDENR